jgi:hypothetical protein
MDAVAAEISIKKADSRGIGFFAYLTFLFA